MSNIKINKNATVGNGKKNVIVITPKKQVDRGQKRAASGGCGGCSRRRSS